MEFLFPILLVVLVVFMFLSMRKQKKSAAAAQEMQDSLQPGARIQTTAGLFATVVAVDDGVVDLEVAPGVVTRWNRLAVREVVHADDAAGSFAGVSKAAPDTDPSLAKYEELAGEGSVTLDKNVERDA